MCYSMMTVCMRYIWGSQWFERVKMSTVAQLQMWLMLLNMFCCFKSLLLQFTVTCQTAWQPFWSEAEAPFQQSLGVLCPALCSICKPLRCTTLPALDTSSDLSPETHHHSFLRSCTQDRVSWRNESYFAAGSSVASALEWPNIFLTSSPPWRQKHFADMW